MAWLVADRGDGVGLAVQNDHLAMLRHRLQRAAQELHREIALGQEPAGLQVHLNARIADKRAVGAALPGDVHARLFEEDSEVGGDFRVEAHVACGLSMLIAAGASSQRLTEMVLTPPLHQSPQLLSVPHLRLSGFKVPGDIG